MGAHGHHLTSAVYANLVETIGEAGALALVRAFGGRRIYVPQKIDPDSELGKVLDAEAAHRLASYHFATHLHIPRRAREKAQVVKLARETSLTRHQIAGETGYSERQVYRIIDEADDDQGDFFGT
jgi:hypothetical protein